MNRNDHHYYRLACQSGFSPLLYRSLTFDIEVLDIEVYFKILFRTFNHNIEVLNWLKLSKTFTLEISELTLILKIISFNFGSLWSSLLWFIKSHIIPDVNFHSWTTISKVITAKFNITSNTGIDYIILRRVHYFMIKKIG